jgi:ribosomal protein RSM22 (predicted rRNA methylase)
MRLPEELLAAIQHEIQSVEPSMLARASADLTRHYKSADCSTGATAGPAQRAAYLAARLPATYAANVSVFSEMRRLAPGVEVESLLDLGGGPGTALFAAAEIFPALRTATILESDEAWLKVGRNLSLCSSRDAVQRAQWINHDLRVAFDCPPHDLVVMSYALGELSGAAGQAVLRRAWASAGRLLAIIEPGTKRGFASVLEARNALIASGAPLLAPCPHREACPMAGTRDWCHFVQRLERSPQHRRAKGGSLGFEDEKFSYVVACREPLPMAASRIVRHPQKHSGHVRLTLCTHRGIEMRTVARSERQKYKLARQAEWGETWEST